MDLPARASITRQPRIVLAFDLDNMYVACERLRNPWLVGKPVGVQQKGLLATASYEARALGVDKLCTLREAKQRCPSLILVNGEDLTLYRYYSRRVFNLVRSVLGTCPVEKLGMDEVFCDVTEMITEHLAELEGTSPGPQGRWFSLAQADPTEHSENKGFWYNPSLGCPGHTIPEPEATNTVNSGTEPPTEIVVASHLANHIRHLILTQIGLGSSAGIAYNKTLAKLVGNLHKPHQQTTLTVHPGTAGEYTRVVRALLDPLDAHKLMGFGWKVLCTLRDHVTGSPRASIYDTTTENHHSNTTLTVAFLRQSLTEQHFRALLGAQNGQKLWNLLDGKDEEPVKSSPEFPLTISIEDSFDERRGTLDWQGVLQEIEILANSLLRRLEIELVDGGEIDGIRSDSSLPKPPRKWQRYPSQIRLTIRGGHSKEIAYNANRESRSAALPVPVFDLDVPRVERAQALVRQPLAGLAKQILDKGMERKTVEKYEVSIINIAVTHLQITTPTKSINAFFSAGMVNGEPSLGIGSHLNVTDDVTSTIGSKRPRTIYASDLDLEMLRELPPDIRDDVLREYGIDVSELDLDERPHKQSKSDASPVAIGTKSEARPSQNPLVAISNVVSEHEIGTSVSSSSSNDEGPLSDEEPEIGNAECTICGAVVFSWSMDAHIAYHAGS
ncbi:DNA/RNA polymerase [Calocera viscosa TUFC12733]|uniref:DNA/RNA polymerase n=1 Tax=Calocera viscosa (strain TUFC12733) TaxID=1330018 RepID=A0A167KWL6_CALVF|nr:DNA/RNA polymerase [Calocera viscosa TUFC12733]